MKPYFGYIRVSTHRQGRGVSLDEQRSAILAYANRSQLTISEWLVEKETAAKSGRTEFTKMLKALKRGDAGGVIIHKIDRGARNLKDWTILSDLLEAGVDVRFAHESLDMRSRGGRLAADIQAVVAADYVRNLRDEVLKGFYGRLKQGFYPLPAPIGYLDRGAGAAKEIDPATAPLVRYAFERYSAGDIGLRSLHGELLARGLKTRRGRPYSFNGFYKMLHNPFYVGLIRIYRRNETFLGTHVPLISKALFDQVQDVLSGRSAPKTQSHTFLYRAMVSHQGCTRHLTGEIIKSHFIYYRCHGPHCRGVSFPERVLDAAVREAIFPVVQSPEDMKELRDFAESIATDRSAQVAQDEATLRMQIGRCVERMERLTDALIDGSIPKDLFESRRSKLLEQQVGYESRLREFGDEPGWLKQFREFELRNSQLSRYEFLTMEEKRELIRELCSNFSVDGKKPIITLRTPYREAAMSRAFAPVDRMRTMFELDGSIYPLPSPSSPSSPSRRPDANRGVIRQSL